MKNDKIDFRVSNSYIVTLIIEIFLVLMSLIMYIISL